MGSFRFCLPLSLLGPIFDAPNGVFTAADNGTYQIVVNGGFFSDSQGNTTPGSTLGTFEVNIPTVQTIGIRTYSIARSGGFSSANNGTYLVVVEGNTVFDAAGNPVDGGPIGTLELSI